MSDTGPIASTDLMRCTDAASNIPYRPIVELTHWLLFFDLPLFYFIFPSGDFCFCLESESGVRVVCIPSLMYTVQDVFWGECSHSYRFMYPVPIFPLFLCYTHWIYIWFNYNLLYIYKLYFSRKLYQICHLHVTHIIPEIYHCTSKSDQEYNLSEAKEEPQINQFVHM